MIFATLTYKGYEMTLADWKIIDAMLRWQASGKYIFTITMLAQADAPDPFLYRDQIILRAGRTVLAEYLPADGLPPSGMVNAFSGGTEMFIGRLARRGRRSASGGRERISFRFVDPFTFSFGRLLFRKARNSYGSSEQTQVDSPVVVLGYSANANFSNMNYLSLRQELCEIAAWAKQGSVNEFGAAEFQFDTLTTTIDGANYDLLENATANCSIPDYVPGTYGDFGTAGASLGTCIDPDGLVLRPALDAVNNIMCDVAFARTLSAVGGPGNCAVWFDWTTTPPTLKIATRDTLPDKSFPFVGNVVEADIEPRDDLVPNAVDLMFQVNTTEGGSTYSQLVRDIAAYLTPGTLTEGIGQTGALTTLTGGSLTSTIQNELKAAGEGTQSIAAQIDIDGGDIAGTSQTQTLVCVPLSFGNPYGESSSGADLVCWQTINPSFRGIQAPSGATTLKLLSGPTFTDPATNASVDVSGYSYVVANGGVASWMASGETSGAVAKVRVTASFSYTEANGNQAISASHTMDALLTNLDSGSYTAASFSSFDLGETVPYGLAGFMLKIQSQLQHEGTHTIFEQDISPAMMPGFNFNLTGGLAEWAAMNAYVPQLEWDFKTGKTRLTLGPRAFLKAQDLVDNIRRDTGPRGVLSFNTNILNTAD